MAKLTGSGKVLKRIDNYVVYELDGDVIIRRNSGFTPEGMKSDPKYALSRQNAIEFGKVSSLCKQMRQSLAGILPKKNGLFICNSLVKVMRSLIALDQESVRGERLLWKAFGTAEAKSMMTGYCFNKTCVFLKEVERAVDVDSSGNLNLDCLSSANYVGSFASAACLGVRWHHLDFDFKDGGSVLYSSNWLFLKADGAVSIYTIMNAFPEVVTGVLFSIVELGYFVENNGSFVPVLDDSNKIVMVLRVE